MIQRRACGPLARIEAHIDVDQPSCGLDEASNCGCVDRVRDCRRPSPRGGGLVLGGPEPGPSLAWPPPRYASSGIGSGQSGDLARAMGGGSDGRCRLSRIARAGSSSRISAMNFRRPPHAQAKASTSWMRFRSSAQSIQVVGSRTAAGATYLGSMAAVQYGAGSLHRRVSVGKVDDFTIRAVAEMAEVGVVAAVAAAVAAVAAAVVCAEQMPSSLCLMKWRTRDATSQGSILSAIVRADRVRAVSSRVAARIQKSRWRTRRRVCRRRFECQQSDLHR